MFNTVTFVLNLEHLMQQHFHSTLYRLTTTKLIFTENSCVCRL